MATTITLNAATIVGAIAFMSTLGGAGSWTFTKMQEYNERMDKIVENESHHKETDKRVKALECYLQVRPIWDCPEIARLVTAAPTVAAVAADEPFTDEEWAELERELAEIEPAAGSEEPLEAVEERSGSSLGSIAAEAFEEVFSEQPAADLTFEQRTYEEILEAIPDKEEKSE